MRRRSREGGVCVAIRVVVPRVDEKRAPHARGDAPPTSATTAGGDPTRKLTERVAQALVVRKFVGRVPRGRCQEGPVDGKAVLAVSGGRRPRVGCRRGPEQARRGLATQ